MREGDTFRGGQFIGSAATVVANDIANLIDREDLDPAIRILLGQVTVNLVVQMAALRREQMTLGLLCLSALGLILWRVW